MLLKISKNTIRTKKYKRYFIIKKLKEIDEKPIIIEELDCSKNTLNVGKKNVENISK